MRYLYKAFFARPDIPLLRLPWNAIAMVAAGVAGIWDPMIWAVAGSGELVYLFTLASNPGFQQWVNDRTTREVHGDTEETRKKLALQLGGAARQRYRKLEQKRAKLEELYRQQRSDDLFADSNIDALRHLSWLFLNLLVAQRNVIVGSGGDAKELQKQLASAERDLAAAENETLRTSKAAIVRLLRERLDNIGHRQLSIRELDADLTRIEAQLDLALEEASLRGRPLAISRNVELSSRLLNVDGSLDETSSASPRVHEEL